MRRFALKQCSLWNNNEKIKKTLIALSNRRAYSSNIGAKSDAPSKTYSFDELKRDVNQNAINTVVVGFTDLYGRLMGKRYDARTFVNHIGKDGNSHVCTYLLTADMELEPLEGILKI